MTDQPPNPPLWRRLLTLRVLSAALLVGLIGSFLWMFVWPRGPIPIHPDVTYLTEPVGPDGYIDYAKALEPKTPLPADQNAAGWYVRATGLNLYRASFEEDVPQLALDLGIPETDLSERAIRIHEFGPDQWRSIDPETLAEEERNELNALLSDQQDRCMAAPWDAAEFPLIRDWLDANKRPLEVILEGTKRPAFQFRPRQEGDLIGFMLPLAQELRDLARVLLVQSMRSVAAGDLHAAASEVDAVYRMSRHINDDPYIIELLVALAIDGIAFHAELALIAALDTPGAVDERRQVIRNRKPIDGLIRSIDQAERFMVLDVIQAIDREARGLRPTGSSWIPGPPMPAYLRRIQTRMVDTEECSRRVNGFFDEIVAALEMPDRKRVAAHKAIGEKLRALRSSDSSRLMPFLTASTLNDYVVAEFLPASTNADKAFLRQSTRSTLLDVACAAKLFELTEGKPATTRSDLVPEYLHEWPSDAIRGEPLEDATVGDRWIVFFRISGQESKPPDEISNRARIDIPYSIDARLED